LKSKAGWSIEEMERSGSKGADCSEKQNKNKGIFKKFAIILFNLFIIQNGK
jgi:hypothetical protein